MLYNTRLNKFMTLTYKISFYCDIINFSTNKKFLKLNELVSKQVVIHHLFSNIQLELDLERKHHFH